MTQYDLQTILRRLEEVSINEWNFDGDRHYLIYEYRADFGSLKLFKNRDSNHIHLLVYDTSLNLMNEVHNVESVFNPICDKLQLYRENIVSGARERDENKFINWLEM